MRYIYILGLFTVLSYMIVVLGVWMYSDLTGYTYFSAGEPNPHIKYTEWVLGVIGLFVLINITKEELQKG